MKPITMTASLARAIGDDAGNRSMRKAGRATWNRADWNAACLATDRAIGAPMSDPPAFHEWLKTATEAQIDAMVAAGAIL